MLTRLLAPSQRSRGRVEGLARAAMVELRAGERLLLLYPCRTGSWPRHRAVLMVTDQAVVLGHLSAERWLVGTRRPIAGIVNVPLEQTRTPLGRRTAGVRICWSDEVYQLDDGREFRPAGMRCHGLRRRQAEHVADVLRPGMTTQTW